MAKLKSAIELERVVFNAPSTLVNDVKEYAKELGVNYTSAYIFLLKSALEQRKAVNQMPELMLLIQQVKQLQYTINEKQNELSNKQDD